MRRKAIKLGAQAITGLEQYNRLWSEQKASGELKNSVKMPPMESLGKIIPFGYTVLGMDGLYKLMDDKQAYLVDIRLSARSRFHPEFNKSKLQMRFDKNYVHIPELGNLNYKPEDRNKGIKLANPESGIARLVTGLEKGYTLILMCACKHYDQCHRRTVVELLQSVWSDVQIDS